MKQTTKNSVVFSTFRNRIVTLVVASFRTSTSGIQRKQRQECVHFGYDVTSRFEFQSLIYIILCSINKV